MELTGLGTAIFIIYIITVIAIGFFLEGRRGKVNQIFFLLVESCHGVCRHLNWN